MNKVFCWIVTGTIASIISAIALVRALGFAAHLLLALAIVAFWIAFVGAIVRQLMFSDLLSDILAKNGVKVRYIELLDVQPRSLDEIEEWVRELRSDEVRAIDVIYLLQTRC